MDNRKLVKKKGSLTEESINKLSNWCQSIQPLLSPTISSYARGRQELWIKTKCDLKKSFTLHPAYEDEFITSLGNLCLSNFDIGLCLYYPSGSNINPHRDHTVFFKTAVCINMTECIFYINDDPSKEYVGYRLKKGDIVEFNCKHLHATEKLNKERWSILFWYLKDQYK